MSDFGRQVVDEEVDAQEGTFAAGRRDLARGQRGTRRRQAQAQACRGAEEQVLVGRKLRGRGGGHSRSGGQRLHKVRSRGERDVLIFTRVLFAYMNSLTAFFEVDVVVAVLQDFTRHAYIIVLLKPLPQRTVYIDISRRKFLAR